jgi:hypothetical protein
MTADNCAYAQILQRKYMQKVGRAVIAVPRSEGNQEAVCKLDVREIKQVEVRGFGSWWEDEEKRQRVDKMIKCNRWRQWEEGKVVEGKKDSRREVVMIWKDVCVYR